MNDLSLVFAIFYGFALVPITVAYLWSLLTAVPLNQRLLKRSAIACALIFLVVFGALFTIVSQCSGNFLYGYTDCRLVSNWVATKYTTFTFMAIVAGIAYAVCLFVFCAIMELRNLRTPE